MHAWPLSCRFPPVCRALTSCLTHQHARVRWSAETKKERSKKRKKEAKKEREKEIRNIRNEWMRK